MTVTVVHYTGRLTGMSIKRKGKNPEHRGIMNVDRASHPEQARQGGTHWADHKTPDPQIVPGKSGATEVGQHEERRRQCAQPSPGTRRTCAICVCVMRVPTVQPRKETATSAGGEEQNTAQNTGLCRAFRRAVRAQHRRHCTVTGESLSLIKEPPQLPGKTQTHPQKPHDPA